MRLRIPIFAILKLKSNIHHLFLLIGCIYEPMVAIGGSNITIEGITSPQECAKKCFETKEKEYPDINGVSVDDVLNSKTCYCHRNQQKTQSSSNSWNCKFSNQKYLEGIFIMCQEIFRFNNRLFFLKFFIDTCC